MQDNQFDCRDYRNAKPVGILMGQHMRLHF